MFFIDAIVTSIDFDMQLQMDSLAKFIISDLIPIIDCRKFPRTSRQAQNQWTKTNRDKLKKYDISAEIISTL